MRIGRDHIASTVYTIAFAAAGAALSVLLLIAVYHRPLGEVLLGEEFAGEIVRTLVGSIGLVLAVPVTTALGVLLVTSGRRRPQVAAEPAGEQTRPEASGAKRRAAVVEDDDTDEEPRGARTAAARIDDSGFRRPQN